MLLTVAVAVVVNWWATRRVGLGMTSDSFFYVGSSEWIRSGQGLGYWLNPTETYWPPGFPVLLAATSIVTQLDVRDAARVLLPSRAGRCGQQQTGVRDQVRIIE